MTGSEWYAESADAMPQLVANTRFKNQWQINRPPRRNFINLYLLRPGLAHRKSLRPEVAALLGNCTYAGENGIIFLRLRVLDRLSARSRFRDYAWKAFCTHGNLTQGPPAIHLLGSWA